MEESFGIGVTGEVPVRLFPESIGDKEFGPGDGQSEFRRDPQFDLLHLPEITRTGLDNKEYRKGEDQV